MKALLTIVKSTLIGGIIFLLPIGIVIVVLEKLLVIARHVGDVLQKWLFPGIASEAIALLFAFVALIAMALAAGLFARTELGLRIFTKLEGAVLARLPVYTIFRQMLGDMAGGSAQLEAAEGTEVVLVHFDDMTVLGFLVERPANGPAVVFLPGAPSALSGSVALVDPDRITPTIMKPVDILAGMRRLGSGLGELATEKS